MKSAIQIIAGLLVFIFLVARPIYANLVASFVLRSGIDANSKAALLEEASQKDSCQVDILSHIGDLWFMDQKYPMAAYAYGKAMLCSPGNATIRFKYGEILLSMGFIDGKDPIHDAVRLEPENPYFKSELERITKLQSQSR